jgi:Holliday junction resolvase RusA-like endonuclease
MNEIVSAAKVGGKGRAYSSMKARWTQDVAWHARAALVPKASRVRLELEWVSVDKRHNPDNLEAGQKFVWDGLQAAGVLENDGWAQNAGSTHRHSLGPRAGVWVTVVPA